MTDVVLTMGRHAFRAAHQDHGGADHSDSMGGGGGGDGGGMAWGGWASQMQDLTDRNAALLQQLDAKEDVIADLETKLIAAEAVGGGVAGDGDPRDGKIIDLSKRNRALNLSLQRQKDMCV